MSGWWGLVWCVLLTIFLYLLARGDDDSTNQAT